MRSDAPSDTAILIAKSLLLLSRDERRRCLVHDEDAKLLYRLLMETGSGPIFEWMTRHRLGRSLLFGVERLLLDGIQLHYACRKRWIEMKVRKALDGGVRQVVIVAAGFDLLAWRLSREFPEVVFFELDHPATQRPKKGILGEHNGLHFLPVDLTTTGITGALAGHPSFSADQNSVCIAEGLSMYLQPAEVTKLLREFSTLAAPSGEVILTFMEKDASGSIDFRGQSPLVARWLKRRREPFRWGIARDDLASLLEDCGLQGVGVADDGTFREEILKPAGLDFFPLARGECVCDSIPFPS